MLFTSVGCGNTKAAVSHQVYSLFESMIVEKNKAERDLQTYTNLVRLKVIFFSCDYPE